MSKESFVSKEGWRYGGPPFKTPRRNATSIQVSEYKGRECRLGVSRSPLIHRLSMFGLNTKPAISDVRELLRVSGRNLNRKTGYCIRLKQHWIKA
jgi:hypothetical protein